MASQTSALPDGSTLTKPAYTDSADIAVINTNMDKIVSNINAENQAISTLNSNISGFKLKNVAPNASGVLELNFTRGDITAFAVLIGRFGYSSDKLSIAIISHQQSDIARVKCIGDETVTVTCTGNIVQVQMGHNSARCILISNAI